MLNVIILSVVMLNVVMLNVVMLSVVAPLAQPQKSALPFEGLKTQNAMRNEACKWPFRKSYQLRQKFLLMVQTRKLSKIQFVF
jgi:hypothetical protein